MSVDLIRIWLPVSLGLHLLLIPLLQQISISMASSPEKAYRVSLVRIPPAVPEKVQPKSETPAPLQPITIPLQSKQNETREFQALGSRRTNPIPGPRTPNPRFPGPLREASTPKPRLGTYHPPRRLAPNEGPLQATKPTLSESGVFTGTPPAVTTATPRVVTGDNPTVKIPSNLESEPATPGGFSNKGQGTGLGEDTGKIPVLVVAPKISPINSAPNATRAQAMVPGSDNGPISPHVDIKPPDFRSNIPGSPDGTRDGTGMAPAGPNVSIASGGGGGTGTDRALPSYGAKAIGGPTPAFPILASKEGLHGTVIVTVSLNTRGKVVKAVPTTRSNADVLDNAAIRAARSWTFRAAVRNGVAISSTIKLKFAFEDEKVVVTPL